MEIQMSSKHHSTVDAANFVLPTTHLMAKLPIIGAVMFVIGLIGSYVVGMQEKEQFFFSYHVSFMYFLSLALGGLFFVIVQFATRAGWSVLVRRFAENIMGTLPIFALLFIPIAMGTHTLFHHWLDHDAVMASPALRAKSAYLNLPFFFVRAGIYFTVWFLLSRAFLKGSLAQDKSGDLAITRKLQKLSYPSIALFALTLTFACFDWIMSLDPHWSSTMFGVYYFAGSVVAIYALLIVLSRLFGGVGAMSKVLTTEHRHDMGKLMFGHLVFWTYIAFSQFFLMWYANMPEETAWYGIRINSEWLNISILLAMGHFVVPFFFILSRHVKRNGIALFIAAIWMLFIHYVDIYWLIMPNYKAESASFHVLDLTTLLTVGGLFIATFGWLTAKSSLVPLKDPRLPESLSFENM